MISTNGINWEQRFAAYLRACSAVTHGAGRWVVVGDGLSSWNSADGLNWTGPESAMIAYPEGYRGITWGSAGFVAVGQWPGENRNWGALLGRSDDGLSWAVPIAESPFITGCEDTRAYARPTLPPPPSLRCFSALGAQPDSARLAS